MDKTTDLWRVPVAVEDIPEAGLHLELEASEAVRAALATAAGLRNLPVLRASFDLARRGKGVHVGGTVEAVVGQACVVTLEPLDNRVSEAVDVLFSPDAAPAPNGDHEEEDSHSLDASAENEPPEPLIGGRVDLGAVATEFLMLGIDPYPRKDGAEFQPPAADIAGEHPFAALAALKKKPGGSGA